MAELEPALLATLALYQVNYSPNHGICAQIEVKTLVLVGSN
jgi:hypothetical protein